MMRLRVADVMPLTLFAGAVLSAALSADFVATGPSGAVAATVAADRPVYTTKEGNGVKVRVSITGYSTGAGSATPGTDFVAADGTLTFAAGTRSGITETFVIRTRPDRTAETAETVAIILTSASAGVQVDPRLPTVVIEANGPPGRDARPSRPG
jgi:beta-glucosidase